MQRLMLSLDALVHRRRRWVLAAKQAEGVLRLHAPADAVADVLFSMADGVSMRMLTERDRDFGPSVQAGVLAIRALID